MKIEIGESLIYSWLKHVKMCQIVQTNWKTSPQWDVMHEADLEIIQQEVDKALNTHFNGKSVFKKNASVSQILLQGESDALGISTDSTGERFCGVDVAFHENGLDYGDKYETSMKVIEKCVRTAMCIYSYFGCKEGDVIFATPKANPAAKDLILPAMEIIQKVFDDLGYDFRFSFVANEDFYMDIMDPVLKVSSSVSDSNELFLRAIKLVNLSSKYAPASASSSTIAPTPRKKLGTASATSISTGVIKHMKIGKLAQEAFADAARRGVITAKEIIDLQDKEYSHKVLGLNFPCLVSKGSGFDRERYYKNSVTIKGSDYYLCSQWFETKSNNDRPLLEKWIDAHK